MLFCSQIKSNKYLKMKKLSLLFVVIVLVLSCEDENNDNSYDSKTMPSDGLIAYYTLDNEALDKSGNQNNGQIVNAISTTDRRGGEDGALTFNGIDSKVITTTEIDDNLTNGLTFSAWVYYTGDNVARIISNYNGDGASGGCNERVGFVFGVTETRQLNIFYAVDADDYIGRMTAENSIPTNEWVHVLGTWDGTFSSNGFELYINGSKMDEEDQVAGHVDCGGYLESLKPFHIGMGHCLAGECAPFEGNIDDVRVYSKVLNIDDIKLLSEEE